MEKVEHDLTKKETPITSTMIDETSNVLQVLKSRRSRKTPLSFVFLLIGDFLVMILLNIITSTVKINTKN